MRQCAAHVPHFRSMRRSNSGEKRRLPESRHCRPAGKQPIASELPLAVPHSRGFVWAICGSCAAVYLPAAHAQLRPCSLSAMSNATSTDRGDLPPPLLLARSPGLCLVCQGPVLNLQPLLLRLAELCSPWQCSAALPPATLQANAAAEMMPSARIIAARLFPVRHALGRDCNAATPAAPLGEN